MRFEGGVTPSPQQGWRCIGEARSNNRRKGVSDICRDQHQRHHYAGERKTQKKIGTVRVSCGAGEAPDQLADKSDNRHEVREDDIRPGGRVERGDIEQRKTPRALHVVEIADKPRRKVEPRSSNSSTRELPELMPSGDEAPIEEARRPDGADDGGKDEQLPIREFYQKDAPKALRYAFYVSNGLLFAIYPRNANWYTPNGGSTDFCPMLEVERGTFR